MVCLLLKHLCLRLAIRLFMSFSSAISNWHLTAIYYNGLRLNRGNAYQVSWNCLTSGKIAVKFCRLSKSLMDYLVFCSPFWAMSCNLTVMS